MGFMLADYGIDVRIWSVDLMKGDCISNLLDLLDNKVRLVAVTLFQPRW